jgi:hypothetical protein
MAKSGKGGAKPAHAPQVAPRKIDEQMTVQHLAQPVGAKPGGSTPQSNPAPKPPTPNQGSQGGIKK